MVSPELRKPFYDFFTGFTNLNDFKQIACGKSVNILWKGKKKLLTPILASRWIAALAFREAMKGRIWR